MDRSSIYRIDYSDRSDLFILSNIVLENDIYISLFGFFINRYILILGQIQTQGKGGNFLDMFLYWLVHPVYLLYLAKYGRRSKSFLFIVIISIL